jgi:sedoheptulose-bisphosphatase
MPPSTANKDTATRDSRGSDYAASCTSFYTDTERQDSYESVHDVLRSKCCCGGSDGDDAPKLRQVILDLLDVCAGITEALRSALVTVEGSTNDFGDKQLSVDVSVVVSLVRACFS